MFALPLALNSIGSAVSLVTDTLRSFSLFRLAGSAADKLSLNWIPFLKKICEKTIWHLSDVTNDFLFYERCLSTFLRPTYISSAGSIPCQTPGPWVGNSLLSSNHVDNPYIVDGCSSNIFCFVGKILNSSGISRVLTSRQKRKRTLRASYDPRMMDEISQVGLPQTVICFYKSWTCFFFQRLKKNFDIWI